MDDYIDQCEKCDVPSLASKLDPFENENYFDCSMCACKGCKDLHHCNGGCSSTDVVEVVRCKDCIHMHKTYQGRYCTAWGGYNGSGDDGYCNYGERKQENE